jgi:hypothetical protein
LFYNSVLYFKDKAYVGGMSIDRNGAKYADFLYKNELTNNTAIIEIKTHRTKLRGSQYRNIFPPSNDLVGSIVQVLDQKYNLMKDYNSNKEGCEPFEIYAPKCFVIAGSISDFNNNKTELASFEMFRENLKDVEIITFDELLLKLKWLQKLFEEEPNANN